MSKTICRMTLAALAALAAVTTLAGPNHAAKPPRVERRALSTTKMSYTITQQGREIGTEAIERTTYNDNTIGFVAHHELRPGAGSKMLEDLELTVVEESFFPERYSMHKVITPDSVTTLTVDVTIEMFANVAVLETKTPTVENTQRVVLPTGAAFVETGMVYPYEQFLFGYDRDLGGRQNFAAMEVSTGREEAVVLQWIARDSVEVAGETVPVDVFTLHRGQFDVTIYTDDDGRTVRVDQNFMTWTLNEWSHKVMEAH